MFLEAGPPDLYIDERLYHPPVPITIDSLHLYPVKGCRAVNVAEIALTPAGLIVGDRSAMIVDAGTGEFISQRHLPALTQLLATRDGLTLHLSWAGDRSSLTITPADGDGRSVTVWEDTFEADDAGEMPARWLSERLGREVRLVQLGADSRRVVDSYWVGTGETMTSFADLAPLLVTSLDSLDDLNRRRSATGMSPVATGRFRPNVVVRGLPAFFEDHVVALRTADGRLRIRLIKPCARCTVTELDPLTGKPSGDEVLRSLAAFRTLTNRRGNRGVMFGQNGIVEGDLSRGLRTGDELIEVSA